MVLLNFILCAYSDGTVELDSLAEITPKIKG